MIRRLFEALYGNAYLLLSLTALFWAGNFVVGRGVHGHVPPIALAWCRWVLATLIVLPFAWPHLKRDWPAIRANWPVLALLGISGAGLFNTLSYSSLNYTTALNALVLQSSGPVLIMLTTFLLFGDRIRPVQGLGVAISLTGVLAMVARGDLAALASLQLNKGDIGLLLAMMTWAVYAAFLRKRPDIHWLSFVAVTFTVAILFNTPLFVAEHLSGWQIQTTRQTLLAVAYVSIFPGLLAYICFNRGVELIGANRAGVFMHLVPFFGAA
ncbi:MAG: DMT family transporter, partial [Hyphomicrobiales bacterium]|nr:DMT family transporter [Hyphomicrobiales bacterium]